MSLFYKAKIGTAGENLPHFLLTHTVLLQQLFYNISQPDKTGDPHARLPVTP
jgi:hypothetical protein